MLLKIKNIDVGKVISFLENTSFKGLQSVNRSKVTNYLTKQLTEVADGEKTIREDFKEDKDKLEQELRAYFDQSITVEGANYMAGLNAIKSKVEELTSEESEQEFSGQDAYALSVLYEAFNMDKGEEK